MGSRLVSLVINGHSCRWIQKYWRKNCQLKKLCGETIPCWATACVTRQRAPIRNSIHLGIEPLLHVKPRGVAWSRSTLLHASPTGERKGDAALRAPCLGKNNNGPVKG